MEPLAPIPTPPAQRWREFRIQALPVLTFLLVLVCIVTLWHNYVLPTNMVGEVESMHANVISAVPGTIKEVKVQRFQRVKAGEEIAVVSTMDTATLQASLRGIEAELKLMRARMQLDVERNLQGYEQIRLDYVKELTNLNFDRINALYYELEANRLAALATNENPIVSRTDYEAALRLAASTRTNVIEKEKFVQEMAKTLPRIEPGTKADDAVLEAIKAQQELLQAESGMISLKAPFDGMVSLVLKQSGEKVVANMPIVVISATTATRIVGYVRRPFNLIPQPGDDVEIRRQSFKREVAAGKVLDVGSQLEAIALNLVPIAGGATNELGLPFSVSIPAELALIPGEPVDLILKKKK